jgi:LysM repeat protein
MRMQRKRKFSLMPLIALGGLSLAVSIPALSSTIHAAAPVRYATVTVKSGDSLWTLASARTASGGDVQETIDQIVAANHLSSKSLSPGQTLRIPQ